VAYSDNFFETSTELVPGGNRFLISDHFVLVAAADPDSVYQVKLMVSKTYSPAYRFKEVDMPLKRLREHSYTILDTAEGQVFLHVNHYGDQSKYGNIYISV